jgi:hypothetical protein
MPLWMQHFLVLALVAACLAVVGRQLIGTFRRTRGGTKLGSCCANGCDAHGAPAQSAKTERIVFIPSSSLTRRG